MERLHKKINLKNHESGNPLKKNFSIAFEYSDCWVEDSRLVFLNVKDAINKGASAFSYSKVTKIIKEKKNWLVTIKGKKGDFKVRAPVIINAVFSKVKPIPAAAHPE